MQDIDDKKIKTYKMLYLVIKIVFFMLQLELVKIQ